jgi:small subunit ribosomal protein S20
LTWCRLRDIIAPHENKEEELPIKRTAYKELRKASRRHFKNVSTVSELRTLTKRFDKLIADKKAAEAKELLKGLVSKINKAASKGVIHSNNASRKISRLQKRLSKSAKA